MSVTMRRLIPTAIVFIIGLYMILVYFLAVPTALTDVSKQLTTWGSIITALSMGFGFILLLRTHGRRVMRRQAHEWFYSLIIVVTAFMYPVLFVTAGPNSVIYKTTYSTVNQVIGASIYAIVLFSLAAAMYRTFRVRNLNGFLLLISAILVMLWVAPVGELMWSGFPVVGQWVLDYPSKGAYRGMVMAGAFGALAIAYRTLLGYEGGHVGGVEE